MGVSFIPKEELVFYDKESAFNTAKILIEHKYVVMLSEEEDLYVLNYIDTYEYPYADRNGVVFMSREDYECDMYKDECEDLMYNG